MFFFKKLRNKKRSKAIDKMLKTCNNTLSELIINHGERVGRDEDVLYLPYWTFKVTLPNLLKNNDIDGVLDLVYNGKVQKMTLCEKLKKFLFITDKIKDMQRVEVEKLSSEPDGVMLSAGVHRFDELGEMGALCITAIEHNKTVDELKNEPYWNALHFAITKKMLNDYREAYEKIVSKRK